jgi:hypothetical protein
MYLIHEFWIITYNHLEILSPTHFFVLLVSASSGTSEFLDFCWIILQLTFPTIYIRCRKFTYTLIARKFYWNSVADIRGVRGC